jgi:hypothetical protein
MESVPAPDMLPLKLDDTPLKSRVPTPTEMVALALSTNDDRISVVPLPPSLFSEPLSRSTTHR